MINGISGFCTKASRCVKQAWLLLAATMLFAASTAGSVAQAQHNEIKLNRFNPAVRAKDGFAINRPDDQGHLQFGAQVVVDYANDPLVYELRQGSRSSEKYSIIRHQMTGNLVLSLGLWDRLILFGGMPVDFMQKGDTLPASVGLRADGFGVSDPWFGARLRLVGDNDDIGSIALQVTGTAPLATKLDDNKQFQGESQMTAHPELLAELRPGGVLLTLNAGARIRKERQIDNLNIGNEVTGGLGITVPIVKAENVQLNVHGEVYGASTIKDFGTRETSPVEAIGGLKVHTHGWAFGAAAGPGTQRGIGAPDVRVIGMIGYMGEKKKEAPKKEEPKDSDGDGLLDNEDQCPMDPEDMDQFEDENGCPDLDNDQDGVLDVNDGAPLDPEDKDGFEDQDGVPDPDNDKDGILDAQDKCPNEAEDKDGFEDEDGCPDLDNDQDGVPDTEDECPTVPGKPEDKGCLKNAKIDTATGTIMILQRIEYATNKDTILGRSEPVLEDVKTIMVTNPQIKKIRVEGHTDNKGKDAKNMDLSRRRARSVIRWLTAHGIDAARLESWGCGENIPRDTNDTNDGRQVNRRVEFHIIDPAPATGARNPQGCEAIPM